MTSPAITNPTALTRRRNLERLIAEYRTAADLARATGKDRRQVSAWITGTKNISDTSARELERETRKPDGWMDREPSTTSHRNHKETRIASHPQRLDLDKMRDAMELARLLAELRDEPEMASDPMYIAYAYEVLVEIDTPLGASNVIDVTKRLAARVKGGIDATPESGAPARDRGAHVGKD
ncbi:hypothetical protein [Noviluteimonas dokdonensis]|uniref:hypothetical protein n=1 Tax=Noviluteimonas dokdonensis TaxID=414050 RepID=UPI001269968F|nr:hypothetical protein [Lysobacter dokdonensis]